MLVSDDRIKIFKKEAVKLSVLAASSACLRAGLGACGPSKEEIALAKAESAMVQACEDSEAAIKLAGKGYEEGLNNVISLKVSCSTISRAKTQLIGEKNIQNFHHNW